MTFANPWPWWALVLVLAAAVALAHRAYARPDLPLSIKQRRALRALRLATLLLLVLCLLQPVSLRPPDRAHDAVVPVLVDVSRSMALVDMDTDSRLARARALVAGELGPVLSPLFEVEVLSFGEELAAADPDALAATARRSDLAGALRAVRERYAGRTVAGVVVISDGGDTGDREASVGAVADGPPVYAIGVGSPRVARDREVLSVTAGDAALAQSVIDLEASVVSHGFGTAPIGLIVRENGQPIHVRKVRPHADDSPVREVFQVSPRRDTATLYTVEITPDPSELTVENNARGTLVQPPGRRRRLLLVEGAPGFEYSFLKRALAGDAGIEVDAVVRKGQNERAEETFYVQAEEKRASALLGGYPSSRAALFAYDAVIVANVEPDFFTREQLQLTAEFVSERGGGLLVMGGASLDSQGLLRTPLEDVLPVEVSDRGAAVRASSAAAEPYRLLLTREGRGHPVMQLAATPEETEQRWASVPALASTAPIGAPRPGAIVLAEATGAGGAVRPLVAVQRFGEGRAMVFAGEAAWRWKMLRPAEDRLYDTFWRQVARWLSTATPEQLAVAVPPGAVTGAPTALTVTARDAEYRPVRDAVVSVTVTGPNGAASEITAVLADGAAGHYVAPYRAEQGGVHRVLVEARRGSTALGRADTFMLVGGADLELADPRLNDEVLRRVAQASGGRLLAAADAGELPALLTARAAEQAPPVPRDLWHNAWSFLLIVALLSAEWGLRRRWGLR